MRHWNRFHIMVFLMMMNCFYPTYEALKPRVLTSAIFFSKSVFTLPMRHWNNLINDINKQLQSSFYPTYEALKLFCDISTPFQQWQCFYPTYEALKQVNPFWLFFNEGRFYPTYEALKPYPKLHSPRRAAEFLPYLWGIETRRFFCIYFLLWERFYPTYEALKPFLSWNSTMWAST